MRGGAMRWLLLVALPILFLAHGFAGAATHLPDHSDHALATVAESFSTPAVAEPCSLSRDAGDPHDESHGNTACDIVTGGGSHLPGSPASDASATPLSDTHTAPLWHGAPVPARPPAKPSLAALSVLRI